MLLKVLLFILVQEIFGNLPVNYIGNGLSVEDYKKLSLCESTVCILDSERSFNYASQSNQSNPCLDMKEFACGNYFQRKTENQNDGFEIELKTLYFQQLKEVLKLEIEEEEPKVMKVVKKYFEKCTDSNYVRKEGKAEAFALLSEFGKFPLFESNWKPSDFDLEKVILTTILREKRISLCEESEDFLICFNIFGFGNDVRIKQEVVKQMLRDGFQLSEQATQEAFSDYQDYNKFKDDVKESNYMTTIDNIDSYLNMTSGLNWETTIKSELDKRFSFHLESENMKAINNKEVKIKGNLKEILDINNRKKLANIFMIEYLFTLREIFLFDWIDNEEHQLSTYYRRKQRFESCIDDISAYMVYPLRVLHQKKFLEKSYEDSFKKFVNFELKINLEQHLESVQDWNETIKQEFTKWIKEAPIYIGYPEALTNPEFLESFYTNLNLTGEEGLFQMNQEMKKHSNKQFNDFKTNSFRNISENENDLLHSFILQNPKSKHHLWRYPQFGTNAILFQSTDILYPVFHADRPHYINSVYLHDQMYEIFFSLLRSFLKKYDKEVDLSYTESPVVDNVLYRNHLKYVKDFGNEANLPGFLMTNHQMSYMILFQSRCRIDQNGTGLVDYFSTDTKGFKETFKC